MDKKKRKGSSVPTSRISRMWGLGTLAGRIAGNMVSSGAGQLIRGQRPKIADLVLTPANISRIADKLASMRGAAMKVGQLISMDSGDFLPKELAEILSRLREDAQPMPKTQLADVLDTAWGPSWQQRLLYFSYSPMAAASIGQVHKVVTMDGDILAVKVQYPGVRESINSDVNNVASLIRLVGILPAELDLSPILNDAKQQLHQEADYRREAAMLRTYKRALGNDERFVMPDIHDDLSSDNVLAMRFLKGEDMAVLDHETQTVRNNVMASLMHLFFKEVFDFKLLQSDPNLANYRYQRDTGKIALLDFGATREVPRGMSESYRNLLNAAAHNDTDKMTKAALDAGLMLSSHSSQQQEQVVLLGMTACEAIRAESGYDFGESDLMVRLHEMGTALTFDTGFWHVPPADALFIHRKLGGLFLLAKRLRANIDLKQIAAPWLD